MIYSSSHDESMFVCLFVRFESQKEERKIEIRICMYMRVIIDPSFAFIFSSLL